MSQAFFPEGSMTYPPPYMVQRRGAFSVSDVPAGFWLATPTYRLEACATFECTLSKPPQVAAEHAREDQSDDEHPNHESGNQKQA